MRTYAFYCPGCFASYDVHTQAREPGAVQCRFCRSLLEEIGPWWEPDLPDPDSASEPLTVTVTNGPVTELRVWLDDDLVDRRAPDGWVHVTTAAEAIRLLRTGRVVQLSLDHDLGGDELYGRGIDVVDFLIAEQEVERRPLWPRAITIHTANPSGRDTMARAIRRYGPRFRDVEETRTRGGKPRFFLRPKKAHE